MSTEQHEQSTALSKASNDSLPLQGILPTVVDEVIASTGGRAMHNFKGTPNEIWRLTALATGADCGNYQGQGNEIFNLCHWYIHRITLLGPTPGEYNDPLRVVLIDDQNNAIAFVSDGIAKCLGRLISCLGMGPYSPPIPIRFKAIQTGAKRTLYQFAPAD